MAARAEDADGERLVVGLMSGTSCDGIDAALVRLTGCGTTTRVLKVRQALCGKPFAEGNVQRSICSDKNTRQGVASLLAPRVCGMFCTLFPRNKGLWVQLLRSVSLPLMALLPLASWCLLQGKRA